LPGARTFFEAMKTLHFLKQRLPRAKIVLGGQTVNDFHETLFADARLFKVIDYAVFGEPLFEFDPVDIGGGACVGVQNVTIVWLGELL